MAMLTQRELEICRRLREFRELTSVSRSRFALWLGITNDRLASYETGRAPVRYEVFRLFTHHFNLNPWWLATGKGPSRQAAPFDDPDHAGPINQRALFSQVFDTLIEPRQDSEFYEALDLAASVMGAITRLLGHPGRLRLRESETGTVGALAERHERLGKLLADLGKMGVEAERKPVDRNPLEPHSGVVTQSQRNFAGLLDRIREAVKGPGKKNELAEFLSKPVQRVNEWLAGNWNPSGEVTLQLLAWVQAEEANQQEAAEPVISRPGSKTRSTIRVHEKAKRVKGR
jgi:DNA-binding transcriptional regulator YiaG